jgi:tetratricopeptide (TPR) repeat protein
MSQTITAIAGLWPLALIVVLLIGMVMFQAQIRALLERLSKFSMKRGQTEVVIEGNVKQATVVAEPPAPATAESQPQTEVPKELPAATSDTPPFRAMLDAIFDHRFDDAQTAFEALQANAPDETSRLKSEVMYHAMLYADGGGRASLPRIEEIANAHADIRAFALGWIGLAYSKVSALEQARDAVARAIAASTNDDDRVEHSIALARIHQQTGDLDQGMSILTNAFGWSESTEASLNLYRAVASMLKDRGDKLLRAVALEKAVELSPSDRKVRFSAAYAESEADLAHVASANYDTLIDQNPDSSSTEMNNIGVEVEKFSLPIKEVAFYRSAAKQGNTLATSNLGYKLLNQGFLDEARELLDKAKLRDDVHPNVNGALAEAARREAAESETWKGILKHGAAHRLFLHAFADARFRPYAGLRAFDGTWKAPDGSTFQIEEKEGAKISAVWGPEGMTLGTITGVNSRRKFEGLRVNRSVVGVIEKWSQIGFGQSGYFSGGSPALAHVSTNGDHFGVLAVGKDSPQVISFTRVREPEPPPLGDSPQVGRS